jgi:hypothetical protein
MAALNRDGDNFDYYRWLERVREEEIRAKPSFTLGESFARQIGGLPKTLDLRETKTTIEPLPAKNSLVPTRLNRKARANILQNRLRRRFWEIREEWQSFQKNRDRDAVYGYLEAVYGIVTHHKLRHGIRRLLRQAFSFANVPIDNSVDPFTGIIRCTCEDGADNKTISKWSRALRYVASCGVPRKRLKAFMKELGGVNACADRYSRYNGRGRR